MAVDAVQLVKDQLEPVFLLDTSLESIISRQVDAQVALQNWPISEIDDQKMVYISKLTTKALIPRLLLKFSQEVQEAEAGAAKAVFADAIRFLEALQKELEEQCKAAALEADPTDAREYGALRPTLAGIVSI